MLSTQLSQHGASVATGHGASVATVEHLISALEGLGVTDACIEVGDGWVGASMESAWRFTMRVPRCPHARLLDVWTPRTLLAGSLAVCVRERVAQSQQKNGQIVGA